MAFNGKRVMLLCCVAILVVSFVSMLLGKFLYNALQGFIAGIVSLIVSLWGLIAVCCESYRMMRGFTIATLVIAALFLVYVLLDIFKFHHVVQTIGDIMLLGLYVFTFFVSLAYKRQMVNMAHMGDHSAESSHLRGQQKPARSAYSNLDETTHV